MSSQKQQLLNFQNVIKEVKKATPVDITETAQQKTKRKAELLAGWEKFMKYYFPNYASAEFAPFHKRIAKKVIENPVIMIVNMIARDHAKTTFMQMLVIYLICRGEIRNLIWVSKTETAAIEMLRVIRLQLENNGRLINDFGEFKTFGSWEDHKFVTRSGVSCRALGKGQSPRGAKEEEARPDCIVIDDWDDDEECRNEKRLDDTYEWGMGALFGAFDIKGNKRFIVNNNKIAKNSLTARVAKIADHVEVVNIYDKDGNPSWNRYTKAECEYMINKMGTLIAQKEYFNNPITQGKIFKNDWLQYKKLPKLSQYKHLVAYLDPSFSDRKNSDHKALILVGLLGGQYHIIKAYCGVASIAEMVLWHYDLDQYLKLHQATAKFYMEEVFMQRLLYKDFEEGAKKQGYPIPVQGDTRKKPDKDSRISATSGYFERGQAFFNEAEKNNHHMQRLVEQFQLFDAGKTGIKKDGPDAVEGAIHKLKELIYQEQPPVYGQRKPNKYRM